MPATSESFDEMVARRKRVLEQSEIREITGVVSARGSGGVGTKVKDVWMLVFDFACWKLEDGEVQTLPLYVHKDVSRQDLQIMRERIRVHNVLRIRAHFATDILPNRAEALLIELVGEVESDPQLNQRVQDLQKPVAFVDNQFGQFTLDRRLNWYSAETEWNSNPVKLVLKTADDLNYDDTLLLAKLLWEVQVEWNNRIQNLVTAKLLPLKNDVWLEENEAPLAEADFRKRIKLDSIIAYPSKSIEFWFSCGVLFEDHDILVRAKFPEGPYDASLAG